MKIPTFLFLTLLLSPVALSGQIQRNSLSIGLDANFLYVYGEFATTGKGLLLYSVSERLALGFGAEYFTTGRGEFDTRSLAFQPTVRLYLLNAPRLQWLIQGHLGIYKLYTFDGTPGPSVGIATGPRISISRRLGIEPMLVCESTAAGMAVGLSAGIGYFILAKH